MSILDKSTIPDRPKIERELFATGQKGATAENRPQIRLFQARARSSSCQGGSGGRRGIPAPRARAAAPAPTSATVRARNGAPPVLDHADMAVQAGEPLPSFGRDRPERVEPPRRGAARPSGREGGGIAVRHVGERFIAQHPIDADLGELGRNSAFQLPGDRSGRWRCPVRSTGADLRTLAHRSPCDRRRRAPGSEISSMLRARRSASTSSWRTSRFLHEDLRNVQTW